MEELNLRTLITSLRQGKTLVTNIIDQTRLDVKFDHPILRSLVKYSDNITYPVYFIVKKVPPYWSNDLFCFDKLKGEQRVCREDCIKKILGHKSHISKSDSDRIVEAFRTAVMFGSRGRFRENKIGNLSHIPCDKCGTICPTHKQNSFDNAIHVDHHIKPFKDILDGFIQKYVHGNSLESVEIIKDVSLGYVFKDNSLKNKWIDYHDSQASFKLLCPSCNCSKPRNFPEKNHGFNKLEETVMSEHIRTTNVSRKWYEFLEHQLRCFYGQSLCKFDDYLYIKSSSWSGYIAVCQGLNYSPFNELITEYTSLVSNEIHNMGLIVIRLGKLFIPNDMKQVIQIAECFKQWDTSLSSFARPSVVSVHHVLCSDGKQTIYFDSHNFASNSSILSDYHNSDEHLLITA